MPTAILDCELDSLPAQVTGLDRYPQARVLVRVQGCPAAWVSVPVQRGIVTDSAILDALADQTEPYFWQLLAEHRVGKSLQTTGPTLRATVAVCTRDRPDDLLRCLDGLMQLPDDGQEFIVVDSASRSDTTRQVVARFPRVRYLRTDRPGLDVARNAAVAAATGEIVAFIDDDAVPDPNWLRGHFASFQQRLVMASMGLTLPIELETEAQELFESCGGFSRGFTPFLWDRRWLSPVQASKAGAGVNMVLRRSSFDVIGPFDELLDAGTPTQSGGELELLGRLIDAGFWIAYTPAALNWHRHRRSMQELRHTLYGYGVGVYSFWTKRLLNKRDATVPLIAASWLSQHQLPDLMRAMLNSEQPVPWPLQWEQLRGSIVGPAVYLRAKRTLKRHARPDDHQALLATVGPEE